MNVRFKSLPDRNPLEREGRTDIDGSTAADVQMSFPLEAAAARGGLDDGRRKCMAFLEKIHARPAYHRALVRGGPYAVGR